jgi:hypothetical protein
MLSAPRMRVLSCILGVTIFLFLSTSPTAQENGDASVRSVRRALASLRDGESKEEVGARLRVLGLPAMQALLDAWAMGIDGRVLSDQEARIVQGAILALPTRSVLRHLEENLSPQIATYAQKRNAFAILGQIGHPKSISFMVTLASTARDDRTAPHLQAALAGVARRDTRALDTIRDESFHTDDWLTPVLLRSMGDAGVREGLRVLAPLLFARDEFTAIVLAQIGSIAERVGPPFTESLVSDVRPFLHSQDSGVRAASARAVGHLGDIDSMARLIELLDTTSAQVRSESLSSLKQIAGRTFGTDTKRWQSWHLGELAWWRSTWPNLRETLQSSEPAEVAQAMRAVVRRRLFRDQVAEEVSKLLFDPDPILRRLACQSLGQLGSEVPLIALMGTLDDPDEEVARSAHQALARLTSLQLPADSNGWRERIGIRR